MLDGMSRVTVARKVRRFADGAFHQVPDVVAGEEPLEIRAGGRTLTVTMRTPGHDIELAHGWLHGEGVIAGPEDVRGARYCAGSDSDSLNTYNVLDVSLTDPAGADVGAALDWAYAQPQHAGAVARQQAHRLVEASGFLRCAVLSSSGRLGDLPDPLAGRTGRVVVGAPVAG